jgi:hypothetical protein
MSDALAFKVNIMKTYIAILSVALGAACASMPAVANETQESTLISLEETWNNEAKVGDIAALNDLISERYEADTPDGKLVKKDMLKQTDPSVSQSLENMSATIAGETATVTGENVVTFANGRVKKFEFTDKFALEDGKWRAVRTWVVPK